MKNSILKGGTVAMMAFLLWWPTATVAKSFTDVIEMDAVVHFINVGIGYSIFMELSNKQHEVIIYG